MIRATVLAIAVDLRSQPVILLKPEDSDAGEGLLLPIWIGEQEAASIAIAVEGGTAPRPLAHDLMRDMLDALHATLERVDITRLDGGTFYAEARISTDQGSVVLDCRPSDAIALASRAEAPIWVSEQVLAEAGVPDELTGADVDLPDDAEPVETKVREFRDFLDHVNPEDFQG